MFKIWKEICAGIRNKWEKYSLDTTSLSGVSFPCLKFPINGRDVYILDGAGFSYSNGNHISIDELKILAEQRLK